MLPDYLLSLYLNILLFNRLGFNHTEDPSFFSSSSPPASPRPCPISPCKSESMSSLSMEDDYVDFNSFINKDKKPFSPARKRLNMDVQVNESPSTPKAVLGERNHMQSINENIFSLGIRISSSGSFKRSQCFDDSRSPQRSKRQRNENHSPATTSIFINDQQPALRKSVSIMNVLRSSSEMLRKNRL